MTAPDTRPLRRPRRRGLAALLAALLAISGFTVVGVAVDVTPAGAGGVHYVSTAGSDANEGSWSSPWRTMGHALRSLEPGDLLYARGGVYREQVRLTQGELRPASAAAPITVRAVTGERPVIEGLLWLGNASHWTFDGIDVTWSSTNGSDEHMVKFVGGVGWRLTNAELWGARSYAALLIERGARQFRVDHSFVHDTHPTHSDNQDHLIYVNNGSDGSGTIERNVLARSSNGRGVKLGPGSLSQDGTNNITIRFNTFYDNRGPANIQLSGTSSGNRITGNLLVRSGEERANVTGWRLSGRNNVVDGNLGWESAGVAEFGDAGLVDGGGNVMRNPQLGDPARDDFVPRDGTAAGYGHAAPGDSAPIVTSAGSTTTTSTSATGTFDLSAWALALWGAAWVSSTTDPASTTTTTGPVTGLFWLSS